MTAAKTTTTTTKKVYWKGSWKGSTSGFPFHRSKTPRIWGRDRTKTESYSGEKDLREAREMFHQPP